MTKFAAHVGNLHASARVTPFSSSAAEAIAAARAPLLAEIEALRKRAEDAERDAARWLEVESEADRDYVEIRDKWYESAEDLRTAIDAAIKGAAEVRRKARNAL